MQKPAIILFTLMALVSCGQGLDVQGEKAKIQAQIDLIDEAHFLKDAEQFFAPNNDTYYDVRNGSFQKVDKKEVIAPTQDYLDNMQFLELEKTKEPIIEISDDGTMASYIGAVFLKGLFKEDPVIWVVSWQSVLKKINNEWKIISSANTEASEAFKAQAVLEKVRQATGSLTDGNTISALAQCEGPIGQFKTLVFSGKSEGRMEQLTENAHIILKHGDSLSWSKNVVSGNLNEDLDNVFKLFVYGHEFHWLSLRPQDRLGQPTFVGFEEFNGQTAIKIAFNDFLGQSWFFYYAFEDYAPLGFENPAGDNLLIRVHFDSMKTLNGLKILDKLTIFENDKVWHYSFSEVKMIDLEDAHFESRDVQINQGA